MVCFARSRRCWTVRLFSAVLNVLKHSIFTLNSPNPPGISLQIAVWEVIYCKKAWTCSCFFAIILITVQKNTAVNIPCFKLTQSYLQTHCKMLETVQWVLGGYCIKNSLFQFSADATGELCSVLQSCNYSNSTKSTFGLPRTAVLSSQTIR